MFYHYKHSPGFLMLEMIISLALFSIVLALCIHMNFSIAVCVRRALHWHTALVLANTTIERVRAHQRSIGTYSEHEYGITIMTSPCVLEGLNADTVLKRIQVSVTWKEDKTGTTRKVVVVAGMYDDQE
jgi:type II secretory pathway component PulJ